MADLHLGQKTDQGNSRRADEVMDQSFQGDDTDIFLISLLKHLLKVPNTPQADGSGQNHFPPTYMIKASQFILSPMKKFAIHRKPLCVSKMMEF